MALLLATAALALPACGGSSEGTDSTGASNTTGSSSTTTSSSATTSSGPATAASRHVRQQFDSTLRRSLAQRGDLTDAQIDCVLNELHETLPDSQIQASTQKRVSQAVIDAATQAGLKCTNG